MAGARIGAHKWFAGVLALGVAARLLVWLGAWPGLFYTDSWAYADAAYKGQYLSDPLHPAGFPLFLHVLALPGRSLAALTLVQHLIGLATGVVLYALLLARGVKRGLAAAAAALVLLDGWAIALEQHLLAEALFTLVLLAALALAAWRGKPGSARLAGSGALLAAAVLIRPVALFAVPVWLIYLLWTRPPLRSIAIAVLACALPLALYSVVHHAKQDSYGFTSASGWQLYGRVGEFVDCRGARVAREVRPLCVPPKPGAGALYYVFDPSSPANRLFHGFSAEPAALAHSDRVLRRFAIAQIRAHPLDYARAVGSDFLRFLTPGAGSRGSSDRALELATVLNPAVRDRWFAGYRAPRASGAARDYVRLVHAPRWLLALLALASLAAVALPGAAAARREVFLLAGSGIAMLIGAAATSEFVLRYLEPSVPLIAAGGALACSALAARRADMLAPATPVSRPTEDRTWPRPSPKRSPTQPAASSSPDRTSF
ncbi:MAG: hypothetical protein ACJ76V_08370 [Thermoleophilaceae bacterium]